MNILFVSHYFPPYKSIASKRIDYFTDYLNKKGYGVIIVKASNEVYGDNITEFNETKFKIYEVKTEKYSQSSIHKIKTVINYFRIINKAIKENKIDILYFNGGPFFYFPLGRIFYWKYKLKYILDFRDPWNIGSHKSKSFGLIFGKMIEKFSIKDAKLVINVTDSAKKVQLEYIRPRKNQKFITIKNGYDDRYLPNLTKFRGKRNISIKDKIKVGIWGKFGYYDSNHLDILIESVNYLKEHINIEVFHIGDKEEKFIEKVKAKGLDSYFNFLGHMPYKDGLKKLLEMDVFLLNHRQPSMVGTKIYDYIYLNKPIIAFTNYKSDEISKLLSRFNNAYIIRNEKEFVLSINNIIDNNILVLDNDLQVNNYSRAIQAEKLYREITSI